MPQVLPSFATMLARRMLPILLVALSLVAGSAAVMLWFDAREDWRTQQAATAQSAAAAVSGELMASQAALRGMAGALDAIESREGTRGSIPLDAGRDIPGMAALLLVNTNDVITQVVLPSGDTRTPQVLAGINLSRVRGFAEARDKREARLVPGIIDDRRLVLAVQPVERGLLVLLVDPAALLRAVRINGDNFVVLLDESGMPICATLSAPASAGHEIGRTVPAPPKLRPSSLRIGDETYFATRLGIPDTPWTVILCSPDTSAYVGFYRATGLLVALVVAIAAAASLAVMLSTRHAVSPLLAIPEQTAEEEVPGIQPYAELDAISQRIRHLVSQLQERNLRLRRVGDILAYVAEGPAARPYQDFFQALAYELAAATQARCVLITEWVAGAKPRADILAVRSSHPLPDDFTYELIGNPCHQLAEKPLVHIQQGAARQYPESPLLRMVGAEGYVAVALVMGDGSIGGHIEIISDQELIVEPELRDLLSAVATRSAAELERVRVNRRVEENRRRDDELRADSSELVCRWSPAGTITFANDAMLRWYGRQQPALVGTSFFQLLKEEDRPRLLHHNEKLENTGLAIDLRLQLPGGSVHRLRTVVRAIRDAQGRVVEFQGTAADISAVRDLETSVSECRELIELIRQNVPLAMWISDWANHRCVWQSSAMASLWPVPTSEMTDTPMAWTAAIHEEDRQRVARSYLLYAADGQYLEEYRVQFPGGQVCRMRHRAVPIRDADGSVVRMVNFVEPAAATADAT